MDPFAAAGHSGAPPEMGWMPPLPQDVRETTAAMSKGDDGGYRMGGNERGGQTSPTTSFGGDGGGGGGGGDSGDSGDDGGSGGGGGGGGSGGGGGGGGGGGRRIPRVLAGWRVALLPRSLPLPPRAPATGERAPDLYLGEEGS
jgi:hypothetical protein